MIGDADIVKPEHAVDMFRLLPYGQLAILPCTNHFAPVYKPDLILSLITPFLSSGMPKPKAKARFG
jgi:pimeloyl-ACP methyl ester carboxylesterase